MKTLKTDVIIPAYHPGEEFEKLLERLSAQTYPINKILVMNTEKKFWKEIWEQKYPLVEVRHLTKEEFDASNAFPGFCASMTYVSVI